MIKRLLATQGHHGVRPAASAAAPHLSQFGPHALIVPGQRGTADEHNAFYNALGVSKESATGSTLSLNELPQEDLGPQSTLHAFLRAAGLSDAKIGVFFKGIMTKYSKALALWLPTVGVEAIPPKTYPDTAYLRGFLFLNTLLATYDTIKGSSNHKNLRAGIRAYVIQQYGVPREEVQAILADKSRSKQDILAYALREFMAAATHAKIALPFETIIYDTGGTDFTHKFARGAERLAMPDRHHVLTGSGVSLGRIPSLGAEAYADPDTFTGIIGRRTTLASGKRQLPFDGRTIKFIVSAAGPNEINLRVTGIAHPTAPAHFILEGIHHITIPLIDFGKMMEGTHGDHWQAYHHPKTGEHFAKEENWTTWLHEQYDNIAPNLDMIYSVISEEGSTDGVYFHCKAGKGRSLFLTLITLLRHPDLLFTAGNRVNDILSDAVDHADSKIEDVLRSAGVIAPDERLRDPEVKEKAKAGLISALKTYTDEYSKTTDHDGAEPNREILRANLKAAAAAVITYVHHIRPYIDHKPVDWQAAVDFISYHLHDSRDLPVDRKKAADAPTEYVRPEPAEQPRDQRQPTGRRRRVAPRSADSASSRNGLLVEQEAQGDGTQEDGWV